jgi:hypothetical protein
LYVDVRTSTVALFWLGFSAFFDLPQRGSGIDYEEIHLQEKEQVQIPGFALAQPFADSRWSVDEWCDG